MVKILHVISVRERGMLKGRSLFEHGSEPKRNETVRLNEKVAVLHVWNR